MNSYQCTFALNNNFDEVFNSATQKLNLESLENIFTRKIDPVFMSSTDDGVWGHQPGDAVFAQHQTTILLAKAILFNQDEILKQLGINISNGESISVSQILLQGWLKWGVDLFARLDGYWSVCIWDGTQNKLILGVDYLSNYGLYYTKEKNQFICSNHKRTLLKLKSEPIELNSTRMMHRLLIIRPELPETSFENVHRVPPGHILTISTDGSISTKRYWFPKLDRSIHKKSESEIIDQFLEVYRAAIDKCIRVGTYRNIGSHMSGGLDSGSVSTLAAENLRKRGEKLHGFTGTANHNVEVRPHKFLEEDYYAGLTAQKFDNIIHHVVRSENTTMYDSLRKSVQSTMEVAHGIGNLYWIQNIADLARSLGVDRILVGQVGNATVSWKGTKYGLRTFKRALSQTVKKIKFSLKSDSISLKNIELHPDVLLDQGLMNHFNQDYINRLAPDLLFREPDDTLYTKSLTGVDESRQKLLNLHASGIGIFWESMGQYQQALYFDPTADQDLVNFCLSLPESFYAQKPGRYLIRKSMDGIMPDEVVWNPRKGIQNADWDVRYEQEISQFVEYVDGLGANHKAWDILKKENFVRLLKVSPTNARLKMMRSGHITRSVAMMMLLDEIDRF